uniref:Uncharacterized protein n=1 Tax=Anopheles merus TaxID=30066 RepID=A0A182VD51_ANOME
MMEMSDEWRMCCGGWARAGGGVGPCDGCTQSPRGRPGCRRVLVVVAGAAGTLPPRLNAAGRFGNWCRFSREPPFHWRIFFSFGSFGSGGSTPATNVCVREGQLRPDWADGRFERVLRGRHRVAGRSGVLAGHGAMVLLLLLLAGKLYRRAEPWAADHRSQ